MTHPPGPTTPLPAFMRQPVSRAEPIDVNGLITALTGSLVGLVGEDVEVELALAPNLPMALADRGQLEQVVVNLVVSARDAMPGGGSVTIETADVELESSPFHAEAVVHGHYVMVAVTDGGGGKTGGAGPAPDPRLSTSYAIVRQNNGYVWVYSEPGLGTTCKVYLPRSNRLATAASSRPVAIAPVARSSETVLLVEDEAGVRQLLKRVLDNAGFRVLQATNGNDAEGVFARHGGPIDLVVTDVIMPGCGGPELLSRLQAEAPDLRVLYMSGYTQQSAVLKAGIDRGLPFLQKPFTAADLVRHVRDALDR